MKEFWNAIQFVFTAVGGWLGWFLGGCDGLLYALISYCTGHAVAGWTAIVSSIWLLGGLQMLCLGVAGTYIGKIYSEVKARPRFIIEEYRREEEPKEEEKS